MKTKFRYKLLLWQVSLAMALCGASLSAAAHDPLRHDHDLDQHESAQQPKADPVARHVTDVTTVRSLVVSFRETGDDRYLDEAWALLEPELDAVTTNPETLIAAAFVAQSRHRFDLALELIDKALAQSSNNDEAWLLRASIQMVRGETESAAAACSRLRRVPALVLLTCKARVELAGTEQELALKRLTAVLGSAESARLPDDMLAWSFSVAGDLAVAAGRDTVALEHYQRSLDYAERTQVRAAMVDVLLDNDEYQIEDAMRALNAGSNALPLLVRRLIVAKRLHQLQEMQATLTQVQTEFDLWIEKEDWLHAREMARFYLDVVERPALARRLALINSELQLEPEDIRLEERTRRAGDSADSNTSVAIIRPSGTAVSRKRGARRE